MGKAGIVLEGHGCSQRALKTTETTRLAVAKA